MANKKNTAKRNFLTSLVATGVSMSMLVGTTFAWFTDSVTSSGNIIKSGTLDVTMEWADGKNNPDDEKTKWTDASTGEIFKNELWEPGYAEVRHIKISNVGTLALKYQVVITANGEVTDLADVIDVYYMDPAEQIEKREELAQKKPMGTLTEALKGMSETANGELKAGENDTVTIALKMQESAGNKYQNKSIGSDFAIQLLATQLTSEEDGFGDDQYDAEASFDEAIFAYGGTYNMESDRSKGINVSAKEEVTVNGNNQTIEVDGAGFQNSGVATVNDVKMKAGNASNYSNITIGEDAQTTYNNVTVNSKGGGVGAADGAEVIFNSGSIDVNSPSTSGRYLFYAEGEGTVITINDGNFDFNKTQNQKRAYIYAGEGTTVYVKGGNFGKASTKNGYTDGILGAGTVIITGGTFGFDPSKWVADGYAAIKDNDTWTVVESSAVSTVDELAEALAQDGTVVTLGKNMEITDETITIKADVGVTLNLNGHTLTSKGNTCGIEVKGELTIKGGVITKDPVKGDYPSMPPAPVSVAGGTLTLENVTVNVPTDATYDAGITLNKGTLNLNEGTVINVNGTSGETYGVWILAMSGNTINFNGGKIVVAADANADAVGIFSYGSATINATSGGIYVNTANVDIDHIGVYTYGTINMIVGNDFKIEIAEGATEWAGFGNVTKN